MAGLRETQENMNDSLLELMCLTFNKEEMKKLLETYILSNKVTDNLEALQKSFKK